MIPNEYFLHYIWEYQYFDKINLRTKSNELINIISVGNHNHGQGPDYKEASVIIGNVKLIGSVEIHIRSSDWFRHNHHNDDNYNSVILHVIWEDDKDAYCNDKSYPMVLNLKNRIDKKLISKYYNSFSQSLTIPCSNSIETIDKNTIQEAIDNGIRDRINRVSKRIIASLDSNNGDWELVTHQLIAENFGFKINKESFLNLSRILSPYIVRKHSDDLFQVESLVFGLSGFLDRNYEDSYPNNLKKEYAFLAKKYGLDKKSMRSHEWNFSRTYPPNFPTLRLAQWSKLLASRKSLFNTLLSIDKIEDFRSIFLIDNPSYWETHYDFDKKSRKNFYRIGKGSIDNLIINTLPYILSRIWLLYF